MTVQDRLLRYIHGPELAYAVLASDGTPKYVYHTDGQGSVRAITNPSGTLLQAVRYDPYGQVRATDGAIDPNTPQLFGYVGEPYDSEPELIHLRARAYSPSLGRFLQRDTEMGDTMEPASLNRYSFVGGNPVNRRDPSGHFWLGFPGTFSMGGYGGIGGGFGGFGMGSLWNAFGPFTGFYQQTPLPTEGLYWSNPVPTATPYWTGFSGGWITPTFNNANAGVACDWRGCGPNVSFGSGFPPGLNWGAQWGEGLVAPGWSAQIQGCFSPFLIGPCNSWGHACGGSLLPPWNPVPADARGWGLFGISANFQYQFPVGRPCFLNAIWC